MRTKKPVDKGELQKTIDQLESNLSFANPSMLYKAVAETAWGKSIGISPSVVYQRVREYHLSIKTKPGKRGSNPAALAAAHAAPRKPRKKRVSTESILAMRARFPQSYQGLINKAENGSVAARVKLHCLQCCGYDKKSIRFCTALACPLHDIRPYQLSEDEPDEALRETLTVDD